MNTPAGQRAAWQAYVAVTQRLLPALEAESRSQGSIGGSRVNRALGAVALHIRRHAPTWGEHGPMLVAAVDSAIRLFRHGDRPALAGLLQVLAWRLHLLSASPCTRPAGRSQKTTGPPKRIDPPQDNPST